MSSLDFQYDYNAITREFDHPSILIVLTPSGRISRYIYGINPQKRDIRLAVIEASAEKISPGIFRGLYLKCFAFDSLTKTYRVDWGFIISTFAGLLIIAIICTLFIKSFVLRFENVLLEIYDKIKYNSTFKFYNIKSIVHIRFN